MNHFIMLSALPNINCWNLIYFVNGTINGEIFLSIKFGGKISDSQCRFMYPLSVWMLITTKTLPFNRKSTFLVWLLEKVWQYYFPNLQVQKTAGINDESMLLGFLIGRSKTGFVFI